MREPRRGPTGGYNPGESSRIPRPFASRVARCIFGGEAIWEDLRVPSSVEQTRIRKAGQVDRIGEYFVRRLVGEGGMGKVYEAEERLSKRRVALKVLRTELARSEEGRRLFLNEMKILAHLDHPNIVRSLACTEVDGDLVMALEFLDGQTLRQRLLEAGTLRWDEAVDVATQVASALDVAHRQEPSVIHRDLKPENIMILEDGTVKVMDFGIAKVLQALSKTTTHSVGTLQYMSPEQIDATGVDGRSDLYCLGLILYEMLQGNAPFESASPRELLNKQCTEEPPPFSDEARQGLPRGIEKLVFELLEKTPDDRPSSARDVLHDLEPFASAGGAPLSRKTGPTRRAKGITTPIETAPTEKIDPGDAPARQDTEKGRSRDPSRAERLARGAGKAPDTIALIESASEPMQVSARHALVLVAVLSALAAIVTYVVRVNSTPDPAQAVPTADRGGEAAP